MHIGPGSERPHPHASKAEETQNAKKKKKKRTIKQSLTPAGKQLAVVSAVALVEKKKCAKPLGLLTFSNPRLSIFIKLHSFSK